MLKEFFSIKRNLTHMNAKVVESSRNKAFNALVFICILKFTELYAIQIFDNKITLFSTTLFIFASISGVILIVRKSQKMIIFFALVLLNYILWNYSRSSHFSLLVILYCVFAIDHFRRFKEKDFASLLNFTLALVYLFGCINKLNTGFLSGFVIYRYSIFHSVINSLGFDTIMAVLLIMTSVSVVIFEFLMSALLLANRVTPYILSAAMVFHVSIISFMHEFSFVIFFELVVFNLTCMFVLTLNFGGESKPIYLVIWDEKCSFCKSTIGFLRKVDYLEKLSFLPNSDSEALESYGITEEQSQSAMQVVDMSSKIVYSGFYGFRRISLVLVPFAVLFPILSIPIIEKLGVRTYNYVALRRSCRL